MPEFFVLDSTGALKVGGGTGASLPDPLTIPHGGTNIISIDHGEMIYADAIDNLVVLPVDNDLGAVPFKTMCNLVFPGETPSGSGFGERPRWGNINQDTQGLGFNKPASYYTGGARPQMAEVLLGAAMIGIGAAGIVGGGGASIIDTFDGWNRFSTSGTNSAGYAAGQGIAWAEHRITFSLKFRLPSITNMRFFFGLSTTLTILPGGNYDNLIGFKFAGLRFSTSAADAGFIPIYADGVGQTNYTLLCPVVVNAIYIANIVLNSFNCEITITDVATGNQFTQRFFTSAPLLSLPLAPSATLFSPSGVALTFDMTSIWFNIG